jgi:hypothetical protein
MTVVEMLSVQSIALASAALGVAFVFAQWLRSRRTMPTIPSPDGERFLWSRPGMPPGAIHVFRGWARQYGELFRLKIGWYDWVVVNSPAAFKEIFDKQVRATRDCRRVSH